MPLWAAIFLAVMLLAFGVFAGYAIAAHEDLRQINRDLDEIEKEREWTT